MYLYSCKTGLKRLIEVIETAMDKEAKTGKRNIDGCLDIISRHFMIFTIYQPSKDLLDDITASGNIQKQLNALKENIQKELLGKVSSDAAELLSQIKTANNIYRGFAPYKTYSDKVRRLYQELREEMPFYAEEESALNFLKVYLGGSYETDTSEL